MINLTPLKAQLNGKPIAVVGLGKTGLAVFAACRAAGIETVLWDDNQKLVDEAIAAGATTEDLNHADFTRFALLCLSPGIPLYYPKPHPIVVQAQKAKIDIICDIELFHRAHPTIKTIGITGTNGKSTTTALIGHILQSAGVESAMGGNIGIAALTLPQLSNQAIYVFELSSYQLDLCQRYTPSISILINFSPDHIDRHGSMEGYVAAKERIFRNEGTAIIGIDDDWSVGVYDRTQSAKKRKTISVSCTHKADETVTARGILQHNGKDIFDLTACPTLQGQHNWQNAAIAYAACLDAGVTPKEITAALMTFPGLIHRQNIVATYNGIRYINDSKATNDQAAAMALRTYNPIYWIAGGLSKESGYADCEKYIDHVRHSFLIGKAAAEIAAWLEQIKQPYTLCETLDNALTAAHLMAQGEKEKNAVVLLSPACASWDQFKSFEHRGNVFVDLVRKLAPS